MNTNKKKAAIKNYGEGLKTNQAETEALMAEKGFTQDEIFEISEAVLSEETEAPKETKPEKPKKSKYTHEKWKVSCQFRTKGNDRKFVLDENDEKILDIDKVKMIRGVRITDEAAEILNANTYESKIHYFKL